MAHAPFRAKMHCAAVYYFVSVMSALCATVSAIVSFFHVKTLRHCLCFYFSVCRFPHFLYIAIAFSPSLEARIFAVSFLPTSPPRA